MANELNQQDAAVVRALWQAEAQKTGVIELPIEDGTKVKVLVVAVSNTLLLADRAAGLAAVLDQMGLVLTQPVVEDVLGEVLRPQLTERGRQALEVLGRIGGRR